MPELAVELNALSMAVAAAETGGRELPEDLGAAIEALAARVAALGSDADMRFVAITPVLPLCALPEALVVLVLSHVPSTSLTLVEQSSKRLAAAVPHAVAERMRMLGGSLPQPRWAGEPLLQRAFFAESLARQQREPGEDGKQQQRCARRVEQPAARGLAWEARVRLRARAVLVILVTIEALPRHSVADDVRHLLSLRGAACPTGSGLGGPERSPRGLFVVRRQHAPRAAVAIGRR